MPFRYKARSAGKYYYIYSSGYGDRIIFRSAEDYKRFILRLKQLSDADGSVKILAYCLSNKAYHLVLEENIHGSIARFMHRLAISYAAYFNSRYGLKGKVFKSPYKERPIAAADDLCLKVAELHRLPMLHQVRPETYSWSSYRAYLKGSSPWLHKEPIIEYLRSDNFPKALITFTNSVSLANDL